MFRTIAESILYHYMNSYARLFPVRTIDVKLACSVREVFFKQIFSLHIIVYLMQTGLQKNGQKIPQRPFFTEKAEEMKKGFEREYAQ